MLIPWNQFSELDPTVVTRELPTKWQKEVFKRELITMLVVIHVENSEQLLGLDKLASKQFIPDNCSQLVPRNAFHLFRRP